MTRHPMIRHVAAALGLSAVLMTGCGLVGDSEGDSEGPWLGNWVLVNFLTEDDGGVWDEDDTSGLGLLSTVTEEVWVIEDDFEDGCAVTYSYTITGGSRYTRESIGRSESCDPSTPLGVVEEGTLEFEEDGLYMIEHFDDLPGGDLEAFRWRRQ